MNAGGSVVDAAGAHVPVGAVPPVNATNAVHAVIAALTSTQTFFGSGVAPAQLGGAQLDLKRKVTASEPQVPLNAHEQAQLAGRPLGLAWPSNAGDGKSPPQAGTVGSGLPSPSKIS